MALPVIALTLGGSILSGLTVFFMTKLPQVLAAMGLSAVMYKGLELIMDRVIAGVVQAVGQGGAVVYGGTTIDMIGMMGSAGLFSAINVILSGYAALFTIKGSKVILRALAK